MGCCRFLRTELDISLVKDPLLLCLSNAIPNPLIVAEGLVVGLSLRNDQRCLLDTFGIG